MLGCGVIRKEIIRNKSIKENLFLAPIVRHVFRPTKGPKARFFVYGYVK